MKKILYSALTLISAIGFSATPVLADPSNYQFNILPTVGSVYTQYVDANATFPNSGAVFGTDPTTGDVVRLDIGPFSGLQNTGTGLTVHNLSIEKIWDGNGTYLNTILDNINTATSTLGANLASLSATVAGLTSSTVATSTVRGMLSTVATTGNFFDLSNKPATTTPTINTSNRTLNSCFLISSSKDALVSYSVDIDSTVTLTGGAVGQLALTTYTDSGCSTGSVVVSRAKAGLTGSLVVGVTLNNPATATVGGFITRGLYTKLVTTNVTGTPTFTANTAQEVLGNLVQ